MVSRRNFITITLIMLVLLFMFQTPEVMKDRMNDYDANAYAKSAGSSFDGKDMQAPGEASWDSFMEHIVYIGNAYDQTTGSMVRQWCAYSKRYMDTYPSVFKYSFSREKMPEAVVIDCKYLDIDEGTDKLVELAGQGVNLIFCNLPNLRKLKGNMEFRKLLGIRAILFDRVHVKGIHLQEGFLLGGEKVYRLDDKLDKSYQDMNLAMPWYQVASGTKIYMAGILDDGATYENWPAVIWRNSVGKAKVFAVNGDYMSSNIGMGILEAMLYETKQYALYPIVNAQTLAVLNYPCLASENESEMQRRYSRSLKAVFRDVIWPGLSATSEKNMKKMTCFVAPQLNYLDENKPQRDELIYYLKILQEKKAEAGLSGTIQRGKGIGHKVKSDEKSIGKMEPEYKYLSFYQAKLADSEVEQALSSELFKNVRTALSDYDNHGMLLSYFNDSVTRQLIVNDGFSHTFLEDFRQNSIETAIGYSSIAIDMGKLAFPASERDSWEKLYEKFAGFTTTYWKAYEKLSSTTMAESDERIRRFLALNYTQERTGNEIHLHIENFEKEAYFILRLQSGNWYVKEAKGASFAQLDDKSYLVTATMEDVALTIGEEHTAKITD